jgi:hypothetical protein
MTMFVQPEAMPKVLELYLEITQYPILAGRIREHMREEIFARGVVQPETFEAEVRAKAILSQQREGLSNPPAEEPSDVWNTRLQHVRDHLTDFYFAYNLPHSLFGQIVEQVIREHAPRQEVILSFNPELAPWDMLFAQADAFEELPPEKREAVQHHLEEIIVVLIKSMVSDQLDFVGVAKEVFTIADLKEIRRRRIGRGKIGGKSAGMLLAYKLLQRAINDLGVDFERHITIPDSYFIGADVFYEHHLLNSLHPYMNQKYKPYEEIVAEQPRTRQAYLEGRLPDYVTESLRNLLDNEIGDTPIIVRSSSLLEDNFNTSFAGRYESHFLANQGTLDENLEALCRAIKMVYASVINPDALLYRRQRGLLDYDERMAILLQKVEGRRRGNYFYPMLACVGFSFNPFRWSSVIRSSDGLLRLVCGLGTRAVERVGSDYPRMFALSHPHLRPEAGADKMRRYSQHYIDVIDLKDNCFCTLPLSQIISTGWPALRMLASLDQGTHIQPLIGKPVGLPPEQLVLTFDGLSHHTSFVELMRKILGIVERGYGRPVDMEFAIEIEDDYPCLEFQVSVLQCRPLSQRQGGDGDEVPTDVPEEEKVFTANRLVPQGRAERIRYVVYVDPLAYASIVQPYDRLEIGRVIGRLNRRLEGEQFILMGPGRWGTSNIMLGVKVGYADIHNTRILIELAGQGESAPEASYGTHFFQNLVEAGIFPLPLYPTDPEMVFDTDFFTKSPNALAELLPEDAEWARYVRVIDVPAVADGRYLEVVMDGAHEQALGYLRACPDGGAGDAG